MKRLLVTTLLGLFMLLGISGQAQAVSLPIGGMFVAPVGAPSPGVANIVAPLVIPFTGTDAGGKVWFTGTLTQWVKTSPMGLVFEYQVANNAGSLAAITLTDTTDYDAYQTNVDATGAGVAPFFFSRAIPGNAVSILGIFNPNVTSQLMWIQTNSQTTGWGTTQIQGTGNTKLTTYCPMIPEPTSMVLLGLGALGLFGLRKRKS